MLDFRMETFLTVCQCMNFTRASEKLNITQPAVSQHIHFLEKHYNTKLFRYEGKKLKLTGAGEILRNASLTMMHDEISMQNQMQKTDEEEEIHFGATRTVGDVLMGRILERYLRRYPDAKICMIVDNTQELLRKLDEGIIDFALVEGFFQKNEYDHQKYSDENYIAVCAPDYTFNSDKITTDVSVENLFHERLLVREEGSGTREVLERCLDAQNFSIHDFDKVMEVGSLQTIKELTKAGCGITFLYETAVQDELKEGTLKRIPLKSFEISHEFNFIWRRGSIYADRYMEIFRRFSS
ncbi:LysR family transcriptional regulator [Mediterraneibacter glycyrrhizinilyticus]|uniref:LysR family transcriptional regulator n=1 Tax=Mediterraneibacter glycyrrhizinilyticus TaxID=342942 RepID=UPI00196096C3|nr:LysR family transcriptional regulator [Mediterraneibacter glycyrrhizinilyticus]MBM6801877.1 LysR family transcriptional regulator [Mediterraneibacter glycyrrhizinilyticus]MDM8125067.1 LysR family transcriptional regulator [Mediterraneibacter glycyrrhizinilyticus]MDM8209390.1 LysR family transcriptional regulator [Mediterraneibacter glycyrrhizinilyticus]